MQKDDDTVRKFPRKRARKSSPKATPSLVTFSIDRRFAGEDAGEEDVARIAAELNETATARKLVRTEAILGFYDAVSALVHAPVLSMDDGARRSEYIDGIRKLASRAFRNALLLDLVDNEWTVARASGVLRDDEVESTWLEVESCSLDTDYHAGLAGLAVEVHVSPTWWFTKDAGEVSLVTFGESGAVETLKPKPVK